MRVVKDQPILTAAPLDNEVQNCRRGINALFELLMAVKLLKLASLLSRSVLIYLSA
jgi:hypothetical protein